MNAQHVVHRRGKANSRTSQSARSVAVAKPLPAAASMRCVLGRKSPTMPVIAAKHRESVRSASNVPSLSSCMSLE